ncbi:type II secretion system F family protein [Gorillibacterium sp. sgz5001074]|uniref:type II secretion system F family protein n=1 Tax=Gorillibacterium sp. sgz5001074 TaxID=3446695 RepID=UPI003F67BE6E
MLYLLFFLTVTLLAYTVMLLPVERRHQVKRRLALVGDGGAGLQAARQAAEEATADRPKLGLSGMLRRGMLAVWRLWKRKAGRRLSGGAGEGDRLRGLERRLLQAGRPWGMGPVEYRMLQTALILGLPVLFGGYTLLLGAGPGGLFTSALTGLAGAALLPSWYLSVKIKTRSKQVLRELPDVLDLLTVSLEAGLGFDAALGKLVSRSDGVLALEFRRCLEEIRLGKTRREALQGVKERLQLDEIKLLIASILQAEKLGIGLVQVLRVQSQETREQRKQRAEEEAMKAPIKMLFPLVLFIFPTLFIVLLGPAVIQFIEAFSK